MFCHTCWLDALKGNAAILTEVFRASANSVIAWFLFVPSNLIVLFHYIKILTWLQG